VSFSALQQHRRIRDDGNDLLMFDIEPIRQSCNNTEESETTATIIQADFYGLRAGLQQHRRIRDDGNDLIHGFSA